LWSIIFLVWGPTTALNFDELNYLYDALRLVQQGSLQSYVHGPVLYELIGLAEGVLYGLGRVLGVLDSPLDFLTWVRQDEGTHLAIGRAVAAISGVVVLSQMRRLGEVVGGAWCGTLAALLCATNLTFVAFGTVGKEDTLFWALTLAGCLEAWHACLSGRRKRAFMAGFLIGVATATKILGAFAGLLVALPWLPLAWPSASRRDRLPLTLWMAAGGIVGLLLVHPFVLIDGAKVLRDLKESSAFLSQLDAGQARARAVGPLLLVHLPNLVGLPVLVGALVEIVWRVATRRFDGLALLMVPASMVAVLGVRHGHLMAYYFFVVALFGMVFFAALVVRIAGLGSRRTASISVAGIALAVVLSQPAFLGGAIKHGLTLFAPDVRNEAGAFLRAAVPPGECVLVTHGISGTNFWGPFLMSTNPPPGSGPFSVADRRVRLGADSRLLDVRVVDGAGIGRATEACGWLAVPHLHSASQDLADSSPSITVGRLHLVRTFEAMPERSWLFPYYAEADYAILRNTSLLHAWRSVRMGWTIRIYSKANSPEEARSKSALP
jgi:hypothetical protein